MSAAASRFASDCSRCQALCCVALTFRKGDAFPIDKAPGEPCPNLDPAGFRCRVWAERRGLGFNACAPYECFGAGPAVSAVMAARGHAWPDLDPATAAAYQDDMRRLMRVSVLLAYLDTGRIADPALRAELEAIRTDYERTGTLASRDRIQRVLIDHRGTVGRILTAIGYSGG
ncbi:hypothetical protein [Azospirillum halopraeferens]|uniref:hypothetical protein n=1 Tax=Azospirillum halopraeferens TaxID=34010 RepID=UPI0004136A17|nr:hypothetical protein [Azospirillum halopraeferens]